MLLLNEREKISSKKKKAQENRWKNNSFNIEIVTPRSKWKGKRKGKKKKERERGEERIFDDVMTIIKTGVSYYTTDD